MKIGARPKRKPERLDVVIVWTCVACGEIVEVSAQPTRPKRTRESARCQADPKSAVVGAKFVRASAAIEAIAKLETQSQRWEK